MRWSDHIHPLFKSAAQIVEESDLDFTLLRLTWLYNREGKEDYHLTLKGEPFVGAQVTRQAVARLIMDLLLADNTKYIRGSIGVSEPNTNFIKPSFY